jgi:hypothetical protein
MLDIKWRYVLFIFTLSFFVSWLAFAGVWYAIAYLRGDLVRDQLWSILTTVAWLRFSKKEGLKHLKHVLWF